MVSLRCQCKKSRKRLPIIETTEVFEMCECGGEAVFTHFHNNIPILKCNKCGDTFDAHESYWRK